MSVKELIKGLAAMTVVLAVLVLFTKKVKPANLIPTATGLVILGGALKIIVSVMRDLAGMSLKEIGKGLGGLAGALYIVSGAMRSMPKDMISSAISLVIVGGALKIIASAIKDMGGMSWEEIAKGLFALGLAMRMITVSMSSMTKALPGAFALLIVAGALAILAPILMAFGSVLDEIGRSCAGFAALLVGLSRCYPIAYCVGVAIACLVLVLLLLGWVFWPSPWG
jgi:hypothetical protein